MKKLLLKSILLLCTLIVATSSSWAQATLPFSYTSNGKPSGVTGFSDSGCGTYSSAQTGTKFDTTGDFVTLNFNAKPGKLTFNVKMNGTKQNDISFTVSTSTDGKSYSILKTYGSSELPNQNNTSTLTINETEFPSGTRYIQWKYANKGSSGNIGFGDINLALGSPDFSLAAGEYSGTQTLTISTATGYTLKYTTDESDPKSSGTATTVNSNTTTIDVDETMTVKAVAVSGGTSYSAITSAAYTILDTSAPYADVSVTTLPFGDVEVGQSKNLTFTITPANLTGDLTIESNNAKYSVSPTSIDKDATTAQTITVTAAPTAANDDMDGTITISGGGITTQTVTLSATPYVAATVSLVADPVGKGTFTYNAAAVTSIDSKVGAIITVTAVPADGYMFDGWTASGATIDNSSAAETEFTLTGTTPTLTASFIVDPRKYTTLDDATIPAPAANVTYGTTQNFVKDGLTWVTTAYQPKDYATLQLNNTNGYIKLPDFSGKIVSITFNVSGSNGTKKDDTSNKTDRKLKLYTSDDTSGDPVITSTNGSTNEITLDLSSLGSDYSTGYIRSSAALRIWEITVCYIPTDISVTIPASKYTTFSDHLARDFSGTAVKAYKAKVEDGKVVLTQVDEVPANTGVILYCETADDYDIPLASSTPAAVENNEMIGVNTRTLVEWTTGGDAKYNYILQGGVFKKAATGGHLKAHRAYLHTDYELTGAREFLEFSFDSEEETTGVNEVITTNNTNEYFDLQGRKVAQPTKGLYIVNGKKVVIK
jgi:hypothetical protein